VDQLTARLSSSRDSEAQLQDQIVSLAEQRKALHSEVTTLSGEVSGHTDWAASPA
jgi:cell division protein FtsB